MKKVFAILHEPASYTVARNKAVYDKIGIRYCYINSSAYSKTEHESEVSLNSLSPYKLIKYIHSILKENDIIIMNGYTGKIFVILFILNLFYGKKIGLDSDTQLRIPSSKLKRIIKSLCLSTIFRNHNIYGLPGGSKTHVSLFTHYGMNENRICLMPMVVDNDIFRNSSPKKSNKFTFIFVGRIIPEKNLEVLFQAFIKGFNNNDKVELRIVGDGNLLNTYLKKYDSYSSIKSVGTKHGQDLIKEYQQAHVFVLPSCSEQWGLVVNEAMAAGLPVIVSDQVGAAWDLVDGRETGFIFKYDDPEDLKNKMLTLYNDPELYKRFSSNAYHRLNNEWNYDYYRQCLIDFITKAGCTK